MREENLWSFREEQFNPDKYHLHETLFALGNGYIGTRGGFEEPNLFHGYDGTYINGFYDYYPLRYGENYKGFPQSSHAMLNVIAGKKIEIYVGEEQFSLESGTIKEHLRELNFKTGILTRRVVWISPKGSEVEITYSRLVSFIQKNLMAIRLQVVPRNCTEPIRIVSSLDGRVSNITKKDDPRLGVEFEGDELSIEESMVSEDLGSLQGITKSSNLGILTLMKHKVTPHPLQIERWKEPASLGQSYTFLGVDSQEVVLEKYLHYTSSQGFITKEVYQGAKKSLEQCATQGFSRLAQEQEAFLTRFWNHTDIIIHGDSTAQQGIRFNMFHLLQSAGRDGYTNIAAKGLTGEGYEGHYFWDTEIYILPYFLYTNPDIAKKLIAYRYNTLPMARKRSKAMQYTKGALYPWRTINGKECSAYYPAGTAQYHINGDIAYSVCRYLEATEDMSFLLEKGAEMLLETARLWLEIGHFAMDGCFHICGVTGPDEYTAIVNNNTYTNCMAKHHLQKTYEYYAWIATHQPDDYQELVSRLHIEEGELDRIKVAGEKMYIPYDFDRGLYPQDDSFFQKAPWDFEASKEKHPLLMHYHPLNLYRSQVCKQADLILVELLLSNQFSLEQKKRDYDYYKKITTHDSSLSLSVFSIMANEVGAYDEGYDYFKGVIRADIDNTHGNTSAGIHTANMAGSWLSVVFGYGGMRVVDGILHFTPHVPAVWSGFDFSISFQGRIILVSVRERDTQFTLKQGDPITVMLHGVKKLVK